MEVVLLLAIMIIIGAAIGGVTNSLAIKMLFRPYNAIYVCKRRLPFTPGLIPKRREELARQLGEMVVNHLLTAEGLANKINDSNFKQELNQWVKKELEKFLDEGTVETKLVEWFGIEEPKEWIKGKSTNFLEKKIYDAIDSIEHRELDVILPDSIQGKIDSNIRPFAIFITDRLVQYIESSEGKAKLSKMIEKFLAGRGMLGNMISMFLGNDSLVDKVQPELIKVLKQETTVSTLEELLNREWQKLKKAEGKSVLQHIEKASLVQSVSNFVLAQFDIDGILTAPLGKIVGTYREKILDEWVPGVIDLAIRKVVAHMDSLLSKLQLSKIVQAQVETFSVARLEELILGISRREFKMITYLGALLGGIIGLIQGLIVYLIQ